MADSPIPILSNETEQSLLFSLEDWGKTPECVKQHVLKLCQMISDQQRTIAELRGQIESLTAKVNQNSANSNRPPSSDSPYQKGKVVSKKKGRAGAKKGRPGHRQKLVPATETRQMLPQRCQCGCTEFDGLEPYYTHQHIELPKIVMEITHYVLLKGRCLSCGKINKGYVPLEHRTGYGPRFCALIVELAGIAGNSRDMVRTFCASVLEVPISLGAIQKVIDRASEAIKPHYEAIRDKARASRVNHLDETPWHNGGKLNWLWVMANATVAFFMIHSKRSKEAFESLIGMWSGIMVSDNYAVYRKWVNLRQTCLSHLIRKAKALAERTNPELSAFGTWTEKELRRLVKMAKAPPTLGQWRAFYARLCRLIALYRDSKSEAGTFARTLEETMDNLFVFLVEEGVEPTNNFGERIIRFAVLWRRRSQGTKSDKGNRWVERIVSLRQTCRLHMRSSFAVLVDALDSYFKERQPDLAWIRQA
ncbi:MAG TPA: IS66 family transposase [Syntrophobacteraceae bacterium]|nr:IS66 family transposase [Syntrophobacteraceae bacterium]